MIIKSHLTLAQNMMNGRNQGHISCSVSLPTSDGSVAPLYEYTHTNTHAHIVRDQQRSKTHRAVWCPVPAPAEIIVSGLDDLKT